MTNNISLLLYIENLPAPFFNLTQLKAAFAVQGLDTTDLVALSANKCSPIQIYPMCCNNATYNKIYVVK